MRWPLLDPAARYGLAGASVDMLEPETEADPAVLLFELLAMFGNAVGRGPHVRVGADLHAARHNVAVVGKSSRARKGHAFGLARWLVEAADPGWSPRILGGFGSGEAVVDAVRDGTDDDPGAEDHRLLVREGEFARVLQVAGRDGSTLSPIIRDAWDGSRLAVRTRKSTISATAAHVSVIADVTLEEITSKLSHVDVFNGFANRFVWVLAKRSKRLPSGGRIDQDVIEALANPLKEALLAARRVGCVTRTPKAEELWETIYGLIDDDTTGMLGAVTARAEPIILRFALTYALLDGMAHIDVAHLMAAVALWDYAAASAEVIFGTERTGDDIADKLLAGLQAAGDDGLDGTEQHALFAGHVTAKRLSDARALLEGRGLIVTVPQSTGGRPRAISFYEANEAKNANQPLLDQLRSLTSLSPHHEGSRP